MCKAKNYSNQLIEILNAIEKDKEIYSKELSKCDSAIDVILHKIETGKFNASQGYKISKEIQGIRKDRRKIKYELEPLNNLSNIIKTVNIINKIEVAKNVIEKLENRELYKNII